MNNKVINTIHQLAAACNKYTGIVFTDKDGNIINDENDDAEDIVETIGVDDEDYSPPEEIYSPPEQIYSPTEESYSPLENKQEDTFITGVEQNNTHQHQNDDNIQNHKQEYNNDINIADDDISIKEELP